MSIMTTNQTFNLPDFLVKSHLVRHKTHVEHVRSPFELGAVKFIEDMRGGVWSVALYDCIIVSSTPNQQTPQMRRSKEGGTVIVQAGIS